MLVSEFRKFIRLGSLTGTRLGGFPDAVTLTPLDPGLAISAEGMHLGGYSYTQELAVEGLTNPYPVSFSALDGVAKLFEPKAILTITFDGAFHFRAGERRSTLNVLGAGVAPLWHAPDELPGVTVETPALRKLMPGARMCTVNATQPLLTGLHLQSQDATLIVRATNGTARAMVASLPVTDCTGALDAVVQLDDIASALAVLGDSVRITAGHHPQIAVLEDSHTTIRTSQLVGTFPSYATLNVTEFQYQFTLPTSAIITADRAAALLDAQRLLTLRIASGVALLQVNGAVTGAYELPATELEGIPDMALTFEAEFCAAIARVAGDELRVGIVGPDRPVVLAAGRGFFWASPILSYG
jgi:DNA polymerase III sliding clamp (beta) subunit (PCNA family)